MSDQFGPEWRIWCAITIPYGAPDAPFQAFEPANEPGSGSKEPTLGFKRTCQTTIEPGNLRTNPTRILSQLIRNSIYYPFVERLNDVLERAGGGWRGWREGESAERSEARLDGSDR